jgi:Lrp/AsnC family transcriptional regulator for asnA, asnC and gidA
MTSESDAADVTGDLDATDLDIVAELSADGRRPFREIARKPGLSEGTVRARVARMQEQGYIRFAAVGSPAAPGGACNALVLIKVRPGSAAAAAERLARLTHVRFVGTTLGASDIAIQTLHASFEELYRVVAEGIPALVPDLVATGTLQVGRVPKSAWDWAERFREGLIAPTADKGEGRGRRAPPGPAPAQPAAQPPRVLAPASRVPAASGEGDAAASAPPAPARRRSRGAAAGP